MNSNFTLRRQNARRRAQLNAVIRTFFAERDFEEVETPCLVPAPGQEPNIRAFETPFVPETPEGRAATLYLHTSPEYAMKRLLADGYERVFQIARVFRNGEIAAHHNPEFTMLEFYRAGADYTDIMADTEALIARSALEFGLGQKLELADGKSIDLTLPFERLT
ncbi:MAG: EF-P lysine aminoacylase GenX, partial [Myxococcales bacterium]|nr:EF-P lysine aminoacylase GenX [Myxococcales bacterium]